MKKIFIFYLLIISVNTLFAQNTIIIGANDHIWEKPDVNSKIITSVPYGSTITILDTKSNSDWAKIKYRDNIGYIRKVNLVEKKKQVNVSKKKREKRELPIAENVNKKSQERRNSSVVENDNSTILLPPILKIEEIEFSESVLDAEETAYLSLTLKNVGAGEAKNVSVNLTGNIQGLSFPSKSYFPTIGANGGVKTIKVEIKGELDLPSSIALIQIELFEPNFKVKIQGKQLKFPTRKFSQPELIIAQYVVLENQSAEPNNQIDINEVIDVKLAIQNIGQGKAENVKIKIENNQKGVMLLGVVNGEQLIRENPYFPVIQSGKYETVIYRYFVNSEFTDNQLQFFIKSQERIGDYGFSEVKSFSINKELEEAGFIRTVAKVDNDVKGEVIIEDIPEFISDVDIDIPETQTEQINTYALIIGNEDYKSKQKDLTIEQNVDYAVNDAQIFATYCEKTLGIPKKQIKLIKNATSAEINQGLAWISNLSKIEKGNAKLIFYYSGHGLPHEQTKEAYIIPVDVSGNNIDFAIKIANIYKKLTEYPSQQVSVFLDACFSGGARNKSLISMKGVKIKPKSDLINGNLVVFSSSTGDESSAVYNEKQHGFFTYYLLKKLKETKGSVNYDELSNYIIQSVSKETGLKGKIQTPQINVSHQVANDWKTWKLK